MASFVASSSSDDNNRPGTNNEPARSSLDNNTDDDKNNILHTLEQDLASIIRVRNRLADTPDTRLPKVLTPLLPRLLRRLDETNLALCCSLSNEKDPNTAPSSSPVVVATTTFNNQEDNRPISIETTTTETKIRSCREKIQWHLTGMLSHILERVRVQYNHRNAAFSTSSLSSAPWVHSLLQLTQEKDSPALQSNVTWTLTLSLLQNGLPSCGEAFDAPRLLPPLLRLLDFFFGRFREDPLSKSHQLQYRSAGWLVLDALALAAHLPVRGSDDDYSNQSFLERVKPWSELEENHHPVADTAAQEVMKEDGSGFFDLSLDVLLFWPTAMGHQRVPGVRAGAPEPPDQPILMDNSTGLSIHGLSRMNSRGSDWNEVYLRQLKYLCIRYALLPCMNGLLSGNQVANDRALLLSVLMSSNHSMHGRLAGGFLRQFLISNDLHVSLSANGKLRSEGTASASCPLPVIASLLVLILGDEASWPVLQKYPAVGLEAVEPVLGHRPTDKALMRAPISLHVASRAIEFFREHFRPLTVLEESDANKMQLVQLILDLIVEIQDQRYQGLFWGIQLMQRPYEEMKNSGRKDEWLTEFYRKCLETAKSVVSVLPMDINTLDDYILVEDGEFVNRALNDGFPGRPRPDLDKLLRQHRADQKKRSLRAASATQARAIAYRMIAERSEELMSTRTEMDEKDVASVLHPYQLAAVLFQWLSLDEQGHHDLILQALDSLLRMYKSRAASGSETDIERLLPTILTATFADLESLRILAVRWLSELLAERDPAAVLHMCNFLSHDDDERVRALAQSTVIQLKMTMKVPMCLAKPSIHFYNASLVADISTMTNDLCSYVDATQLGLSREMAITILHHFGFSSVVAKREVQSNLRETLLRCGVLCRYDCKTNMETTFDAVLACGICYNDAFGIQDVYALPCGHIFCRSCWKDYLESTHNSSAKGCIIRTTCPHHNCNERVLRSDLEHVFPNLASAFDQEMLAAFIQKCHAYGRCPGPNCSMIVHLDPPIATSISCTLCSTLFCSGCGNQPHDPAQCADFEEWNRIFNNSSFWVKQNAKPCPSCQVPIEKSTGCNHMTCSQCGTNFCWLCLSLLQTHSEAHTCNRYDPVSSEGDDEMRRSLFFTARYQSHKEAGEFAQKHFRQMEETDMIADENWFVADDNYDSILSAVKILVVARTFLQNSYIAAWAMRNDTPRREVFEGHQATLELVTEQLSRKTMLKLHLLFQDQGAKGIREHFRSMDFLASSVLKYMERIRVSVSHQAD